jgi:hypothetical protein
LSTIASNEQFLIGVAGSQLMLFKVDEHVASDWNPEQKTYKNNHFYRFFLPESWLFGGLWLLFNFKLLSPKMRFLNGIVGVLSESAKTIGETFSFCSSLLNLEFLDSSRLTEICERT